MSEHSDLVAQFRDVTGIDEERARFYLESSAWRIESALASFYENDVPLDTQEEPEEIPAPPSRHNVAQRPSKDEMEVSSTDSEDEEGQAFYVGGSERSGQQVLGPPRKKGKDIVAEMFQSAKEHGAEVVDKQEGPSRKTTAKFHGTGYRLGESEHDTQVVPGASAPEKPRSVVLKLWKTGFSVDEGALREYQDPVNRDFLDAIKRGEVPMELIREARGREVHLQMEDHRMEDYVSTKKAFQAFKGTGHMLGSPAPSVVSSGPSPSAGTSTDNSANEEAAKRSLNLNSAEPSTSVQIRLADGSRLVGTFNHTHTVGDIRNYVVMSRPQYAKRSFDLLTSYPSRPLNDDSLSLKDASLLNSTIMQRLK